MNPKYLPTTFQAKLGWLIEECGEVQAAVGKSLRHGIGSSNPELGAHETREFNGDWILRELNDLKMAIEVATDAIQAEMKVYR